MQNILKIAPKYLPGLKLPKPVLVLGVAFAFLFAGCSGVRRNFVINSAPVGATVTLDEEAQGATPLTTKTPVTWNAKGPLAVHSITIAKQGYETVEKKYNYLEAKAAQNPWEIRFDLPPLENTVEVRFTSTPSGATVSTGDTEPRKTPTKIPVKFIRSSSGAAWSPVKAEFELENYASQTVDILYERVTQDPNVEVNLNEMKRVVPVDIKANVDAAAVEINGTPIGQTPTRYNFTFTRSDAQSPWGTFLVTVKKEGYRARSGGGSAQPGANAQFSKSLTAEEAATGTLMAELEPITYVYSTVPSWDFSSKGLQMKEQKILSKVGEIEREPKVQSVTRITNFKPEDGFVETRISVMPDSQQIVYAVGFLPAKADKRTSRFFSNIWMQRGNERTRLTDGLQFDVEPGVSFDGKNVFFSSDRLNLRYTIWSAQAIGRGGLTKITDSPSSVIDTQASLSPDGSKIAYTSYMQGADGPQIWIIRADGTLPTQVRIGQQPAWSSDGKKIAFVAQDADGNDKIWVMGDDGSNPTQLTTGEQHDRYPCWTPDGKHIVYASDMAFNEEHERNFDIWSMNSDGTKVTQLTVNGSYDSRPTVSSDGKFIYFISNRGAHKEGENWLQIWRIELAPGTFTAE